MRYEPLKQLDSLPEAVKATRRNMSPEQQARVSGINNGPLLEPLPKYAQAGCETVTAGQNNTFIVMGRDRIDKALSGYGGMGATACGAIDIVAGRGMPFIKSENYPGGIAQEILTNPSPFFDASKIYIAQKTDVDKNFRLAKGRVGNSVGNAAIAIKSDAVRIMAREGIKLVTGVDPMNSKGASLMSVTGIDLIAGNNDTDLQPLVKGVSLKKALSDLSDRIDELNGVVDSFLTYQLEYNSAIMKHTHPNALNIAVGMASTGNPNAIPSMQAIKLTAAGKKAAVCLNAISKKDLVSNKLNLVDWKGLYLSPAGSQYINSNYNNTN